MFNYRLVTPPADWPVSIDTVKQQLSLLVGSSEHDGLLRNAIIPAAIGSCEDYMRRSLVKRTYELVMNGLWWDREIYFPRPPFISIVSFQYYDTDGVLQSMDADTYQIDEVAEPAYMCLAPGKNWPYTQSRRVNSVRIQYLAGYPSSGDSPEDLAANIPAAIKHAILMTCAHYFENRESINIGNIVTEIDQTARYLMDPYVTWPIFNCDD